jgi:hypothetical protein
MHRAQASTIFTACVGALMLMSCQGLGPGEQTRVVEGAYDAETRYDMRSLASTITGNTKRWENPDLAIRDAIIGQIRKSSGNEIASLVSSLYGDQIARDIRAYLQSNGPGWLLDVPSSLASVDTQLQMVDVQTSVLLADNGDGTYKATQLWNGITVFRDPDCWKAGGLQCPQISFSVQDLLDAEYPIDLINASYQATETTSSDRLELAAHEIRFNYGRLALYLLTNLIFPDEPGAGLQIRDVVLAAINCRGLAGRLAGDDGVLGWNIAGVNVGLSINELMGSCEQGAFGMVNGFIDQFNLPLKMDLSGSLGLIDIDFDGTIDQLATDTLAGTASASLRSGQSKSGPVSGKLTGFRVGSLPTQGVPVDDQPVEDDGPGISLPIP